MARGIVGTQRPITNSERLRSHAASALQDTHAFARASLTLNVI